MATVLTVARAVNLPNLAREARAGVNRPRDQVAVTAADIMDTRLDTDTKTTCVHIIHIHPNLESRPARVRNHPARVPSHPRDPPTLADHRMGIITTEVGGQKSSLQLQRVSNVLSCVLLPTGYKYVDF